MHTHNKNIIYKFKCFFKAIQRYNYIHTKIPIIHKPTLHIYFTFKGTTLLRSIKFYLIQYHRSKNSISKYKFNITFFNSSVFVFTLTGWSVYALINIML